MGKVIMSGIVPQLEVPCPYDPVFANNTWADIIEACQKNKVPETWEVGDQKSMTINGTDYQIDIIGKNHDSYSDGSGKAPLTFQMHDCYGTANRMCTSNDTYGSWKNTYMRSTVLPSVLSQMPSDVQGGIKEVDKNTCEGYNSDTIITTADKLFIPSAVELYGSSSSKVRVGEGTQYAYYVAGNSTRKRIGTQDYAWWTRSPQKGDYKYFLITNINAVLVESMGYASNSIGVAFAFCF